MESGAPQIFLPLHRALGNWLSVSRRSRSNWSSKLRISSDLSGKNSFIFNHAAMELSMANSAALTEPLAARLESVS
jgi:hypothetical protein